MDKPSRSSDDWNSLFHAANEGLLSDAEFAELETSLLHDRSVRRAYVSYMAMVAGVSRQLFIQTSQIDLELHSHSRFDTIPFPGEITGSDEDDDSSDSGQYHLAEGGGGRTESTQPATALLQSAVSLSSPRRRRMMIGGWLMTCVVLVAVAAFDFQEGRQNIAPVHVEPEVEPEVVADVRILNGCEWGIDSEPLTPGMPLPKNRQVDLVKGTAKLHFRSGAMLVFEGPSAFDLISHSSIRLRSGTVVVKAEGPIKDFVVLTPDAAILDLGTSFGVHFSQGQRTEVEVFEGAVEVSPDKQSTGNDVLDLGARARVLNARSQIFASEDDRFGDLLSWLWEDMRTPPSQQLEMQGEGAVVANFEDGDQNGAVDSFKGSSRGKGWITPWVASGNPEGTFPTQAPLSTDNSTYLKLSFTNSFDRTLGREYGTIPGFDPTKPHVISWKWRYDGMSPEFGSSFRDRIHFYGNPYYRRSSWPDNSWLVGVAGAHEKAGEHRQVFPGNWFLFDGVAGSIFEKANMVDTGMKFKPGVVYSFAIVVHPSEGLYDAFIRDDEQTFAKVGLHFRNRNEVPSNVVHFGVCTDKADIDTSFSLDSIRVEQLRESYLTHPVKVFSRQGRFLNR